MPTVRGREAVRRFMGGIPAEIEKKLLRGAARAGGDVIADEARDRAIAEETREAITVEVRTSPGRVTVKIKVKPGWGRSIGFWLEYGTDPHFISVDPDISGGRTAGRVNRLTKKGDTDVAATLVINGEPVGKTVWHPGARAHPFLRPALDLKERDAIAAAQSYINARVKPSGIVGTGEPEGVAT